MAFVVSTARGTFEVRESRSTPAGPRSRTLVTFRQLSDEVIEKARERAARPLDPDQLREAALRTGAPVTTAPIDRAARDLIAELARGGEPDPTLRRLLVDALDGNGQEGGIADSRSPSLSDAVRSAAAWLSATPRRRGEALRDLLLLADALPARGREGTPRFPRLESTSA